LTVSLKALTRVHILHDHFKIRGRENGDKQA